MSDYTPTTEEVRQAFAHDVSRFMQHEGVTLEVATEWFDCWLEQHDKEVASATEQRIIKLLEELSKSTFPGDVWHVNPFEYAIALIKGEE